MCDLKFVVYLTLYKGSLLPKWYIGSSNIISIQNGYNGSVESKRYKEIFKQEQKENKFLFKTRVLSYHKTRKEALAEELRLQKLHNVVKNPLYINLAFATVNGFFGMPMSGELHPMYGKPSKLKGKPGHKTSEETKEKLRLINLGKKHTDEAIEKIRQASLNISVQTRKKIGLAHSGNKSHTAIKVHIFDSQKNLMFVTHGNFSKTCKLNNLPFKSLTRSYKNNGKPLYTSNASFGRCEERFKIFKGWFAIKI